MSIHTVRNRLGPLLVILSLSGCANYTGLFTTGKSLDAKNLEAEKTLKEFPVSPAAWPKTDWWKDLGDPQLDGLVQEALRDSPDMQIASARAHQAAAYAESVDATRMPTLNADASLNRSRLARVQDPTLQGDSFATVRSLDAVFNYNFDLWGGQRTAWEAALGQAHAAEVDRQAARLTLATSVARAYSNLGYAYIVVDLAEDDYQRTQHMLELGQGRVKAGLDSLFQYQQTESLAASSEEQRVAAHKNLNSAKVALAVLLGKGPDRAEEIARPKILKPSVVALPSSLPAELLGRRPDLVAARWRVEAASKNIKASKTHFYPNLNLSAAAGAKALLGDAMFGTPSRYFAVTPAISIPIFDGGRLRSELDARDAEYDLAVAQYNKTLISSLGDVSDLIDQLRAIALQITAKSRAAQIAQNSSDTEIERFGSGVGEYLDVLTTERERLLTQRQLAALKVEQINLSIALMQALGGGYQGEKAREKAAGQP